MEDKLITIAQFANYIEADMACQTLQDAGIEAVVTGDNASNLYGSLGAIEQPSLQVMRSKAEQAKQILAEAAEPAEGLPEEFNEEQ